MENSIKSRVPEPRPTLLNRLNGLEVNNGKDWTSFITLITFFTSRFGENAGQNNPQNFTRTSIIYISYCLMLVDGGKTVNKMLLTFTIYNIYSFVTLTTYENKVTDWEAFILLISITFITFITFYTVTEYKKKYFSMGRAEIGHKGCQGYGTLVFIASDGFDLCFQGQARSNMILY